MATISVAPFLLKDVLFQVETDNYEAHVSQVEFIPTSSPVSWKGLTPSAVFTFQSSSTWACTLSLAQDWETEDALARYLYDHEGEEIDVTFEPVKGGQAITATLIAAPGSIGGTVDGVAQSTVTLGVVGKPTFTPSA